ncbi:MAG: hypothetical protein AVO33_06055, partial [delta proteobacterium ML8_F1]
MLLSEKNHLDIEKFAMENRYAFENFAVKHQLERLKGDFEAIKEAANALSALAGTEEELVPGVEWILDNFYKVEESHQRLVQALNHKEKIPLGVLKSGPYRGYPRVYPMALELIRLTNGNFDEDTIIEFLQAYQNVSILNISEIWNFNTLLIFALIEKIREVSETIHSHQLSKQQACALDLSHPGEALKSIKAHFLSSPTLSPIYIETLTKRIKELPGETLAISDFVTEKLREYHTTLEKTIQLSHMTQSTQDITIGNLFMSLNRINRFDWHHIFEAACLVEGLLARDPGGVYPRMDFPSRNYYRKKLETLSRKNGVRELDVAKAALALAQGKTEKKGHVGYYLIGEGRKALTDSLGIRQRATDSLEFNDTVYIFIVGFMTLLMGLGLFGLNYKYSEALLSSLFLTLLFLVPVSGLVIHLLNHFLQKIFPMDFLPKLSLEEGIPEEARTFVVIPTLLHSTAHVQEMMEKLEKYYLANRSNNLYFALLGEFPDARKEFIPEDNELIKRANTAIRNLNSKYEPVFFYVQRRRLYNPREGKWLCWERKRGSLTEFNNYILGQKVPTSHLFLSRGIEDLRGRIRYVITLDEDTELPIDSARKLVGTIHHPLNQAVYDEVRQRVVSGYGIIQPHISIGLEYANHSRFTKIYARTSGVSLYVEGISNLYQDIFGEGIFFGKGIYDVNLFARVLNYKIPLNCILSHDLLEGSHIGAAYASDISFIDTHPTRYIPYLLRLHRWIRGDWQLIGWLLPLVKDAEDKWRLNPLSTLSKFKILDNLRRSLESVTLFSILIATYFFLPGPSYPWIILVLLFIFTPLALEVFDTILMGRLYTPHREYRKSRRIKFNLKGSFQYTLLQFIFLPFEAILTLSAILVALYRVLISRKKLLEWTSAALVDKQARSTLASQFLQMKYLYPVLAAFLAGILLYRPSELPAALPLLLLWSSAPVVAYFIGREPPVQKPFTQEEISSLRQDGRLIWGYFEEYLNPRNHYLPPDNLQVYPPRAEARRTSPTNIGLGLLSVISARDMGMISISAMFETLNRMLVSIDRLPKWHGHLYNWYRTDQMKTLQPRYVSTVDSGNLVSYLMVLTAALEEYRVLPVIDDDIVDGLRESCVLESCADTSLLRLLDGFATIKGKTVKEWSDFLGAFILECSRCPLPCPKTSKMALELQREHHRYYDLYLYSDIEDHLLEDAHCRRIITEIQSLPMALSLTDLKKAYVGILMDLKKERQSPDAQTASLGRLEGKIKTMIGNLEDLNRSITRMVHMAERLILNTDFSPLYHRNKKLFSIGYDTQNQVLTDSYYDLMASEARVASFIAIVHKQVPLEHWYALSRTFTLAHGYRAMASWSGTMFEYFMPHLIMRNYDESIFDETYHSVIKAQEGYGHGQGRPWGVSESAYYAFDLDLNYQYKAFGVPSLGFKRGLVNDYVVAPYASYFALETDHEKTLDNLRHLKSIEDLRGPYGLYESIDYTTSRLEAGESFKVVKSYMAHHMGMSLLAINNAINDGIMQRRFHRLPLVKTGEFLLQEKLPYRIPMVRTITETPRESSRPPGGGLSFTQTLSERTGPLPRGILLSNKRYHVFLTQLGTGYDMIGQRMVTRFRSEPDSPYKGTLIYIKDVEGQKSWSLNYDEAMASPESYEVRFSLNKGEILRRDRGIQSHLEVFVSPKDSVAVRRLTLVNHNLSPVTLEVTSYSELSMKSYEADTTHPAFNNLFVTTAYDPHSDALTATLRPRDSEEPPLYLFETLVTRGATRGQTQYETDRLAFVGRGRNLSHPFALEKVLGNSQGVVLEPVFSMRKRLHLQPGEKTLLTYCLGATQTREELLELISSYKNPYVIKDQIQISYIQTQVELNYLEVRESEISLFFEMIPQLVYLGPQRRPHHLLMEKSTLPQNELFKFGISGDRPLVLITLESLEEFKALWTLVKAKEFFKLKGLEMDLVILNLCPHSYYNDFEESVKTMIYRKFGYVADPASLGIFTLKGSQIGSGEKALLYASASLIFEASRPLKDQLQLKPQRKGPRPPSRPFDLTAGYPEKQRANLRYFNGYGGFNEAEGSYVIRLDAGGITPLPWVNILANRQFGCLIAENGGGYTYGYNASEYKITPWVNDTLFNQPHEIFYLKDLDYNLLWSLTPDPKGKDFPFEVTHGKGYSLFDSKAYGIHQTLTTFIPRTEPVKLSLISLTNHTAKTRSVSLYYRMDPVLGSHPHKTRRHLISSYDRETGLSFRNPYHLEHGDKLVFMGSYPPPVAYTGSSGALKEEELLGHERLLQQTGAALDPAGGLQVALTLEPGETREIIFFLGTAASGEDARALSGTCSSPAFVHQALSKVKRQWKTLLNKVQVKTPDNKFDLLLNSWLPYQTLNSRLKARAGFYQTSGALGFRDQLQDALNLVLLDPALAKKQILIHGRRQFPEGDVLHWWHEGEPLRGIRTRFKDDCLWLPYSVIRYVEATGDTALLDRSLPFVTGEPLKATENERYFNPGISPDTATLYEHCLLAIDYSLGTGPHGLPLMGGGDWNDGMNLVGIEGRGESVWLGWFLSVILKGFIPLCHSRGDDLKGTLYQEHLSNLLGGLDKEAWDGSWYKRAFFDDGTPLGSIVNSECMIDSLSQSWSVISGQGDPLKAQKAMESVENHLILKDQGLILLFTPPFDASEHNPGYIMSYAKGLRENGGQYTHAAAWVIDAFCRLGQGSKAFNLYMMLSPIIHSRSIFTANHYKVEPYVIAADIYNAENQVGRGGWTWYTGAAGWLYRVGMESIVGISRHGDSLVIDPCIPKEWEQY